MKRIIYILFVLSIIPTLLGCGNSEKKSDLDEGMETAKNDEQIRVTNAQFEGSAMQLGSLDEQPFPHVVQATGMIDVPPQNRAVVSAFTGGYIKKTPLLIGDKVKKGQMLVTLENPEFVQMQQEYLETVERLGYLKSEYERQKTLVAEKVTSQKKYLEAESEYKRALAMYNGLRKKLEMLNIGPNSVEEGNITSVITLYAPISGSITKVNVNKGMYVSLASEIMEIINMDHIHLELSIFEKDVMKVKEGQRILFRIPEASKDTFGAEVHLVGTSIDEKTRTVKVHGHLNNDIAHNFAVGMFVEAEIDITKTMAKALPEEAIVSVDDKFYVLVLQSNKKEGYAFVQKEVMVGESYNGYTAIKNANQFKDSDEFLVKGGFNLMEESGEGE